MRLLIVDDHVLFRAGVVLLLGRLGPAVHAVEAGSLGEALAHTGASFELILLDLNLRGMTGLDGLKSLRQQYPSAAIVVVSGVDSVDAMREARVKGARGYVVKNVSPDTLLAALRLVLQGQSYFPLIDELSDGRAMVRLTPRQRDVLELLYQGRTNKEIALRLGMSDNTVRTHLAALFRVLGVRTRTEAARAARNQGLL